MIGRGHLWWARLDKVRPAVIVSSDDVCDLDFWQVHVAPITSAEWHEDFPSSVPVRFDGVASSSYASMIDTQLIARAELLEHIGQLSSLEMQAVDAALGAVLGL
jgi:mRNA-degrading endonuclease toxin of MazEF toxin-antitoxin module